MNIKNFDRLITSLIHNNKYLPILAWGESGIGKSDTVKAIAKKLSMDFIDLRLGQMEVGDLIGLPFHNNEEGVRTTEYSTPFWFPTIGKGILFLDEINRSRLEVRQAVFQLILDRQLQGKKLPDGWFIVSAANPSNEQYDTEELYDRAFLARFCHITLEPLKDEWLDYAASNNYDWAIRSLISDDGKFLGPLSVKIPELKPTPRSWSFLSSVAETVPHDLIVEVATGLIGTEAAIAWNKIRSSTERPIKAVQVLDNYKAVQDTVLCYAEKHNKHGKLNNCNEKKQGQGRPDLLRITLDELAQLDDIEHVDSLVQFILDCPKDLAYGYLRLRFITNPKLRKRLNEHDALLDYVSQLNKEAGIK